MTETRRRSAKELARVVDQDCQLSEEPLLKQIVSDQVEAVSLALNASECKGMSGLMQDPYITAEHGCYVIQTQGRLFLREQPAWWAG